MLTWLSIACTGRDAENRDATLKRELKVRQLLYDPRKPETAEALQFVLRRLNNAARNILADEPGDEPDRSRDDRKFPLSLMLGVASLLFHWMPAVPCCGLTVSALLAWKTGGNWRSILGFLLSGLGAALHVYLKVRAGL